MPRHPSPMLSYPASSAKVTAGIDIWTVSAGTQHPPTKPWNVLSSLNYRCHIPQRLDSKLYAVSYIFLGAETSGEITIRLSMLEWVKIQRRPTCPTWTSPSPNLGTAQVGMRVSKCRSQPCPNGPYNINVKSECYRPRQHQ